MSKMWINGITLWQRWRGRPGSCSLSSFSTQISFSLSPISIWDWNGSPIPFFLFLQELPSFFLSPATHTLSLSLSLFLCFLSLKRESGWDPIRLGLGFTCYGYGKEQISFPSAHEGKWRESLEAFIQRRFNFSTNPNQRTWFLKFDLWADSTWIPCPYSWNVSLLILPNFPCCSLSYSHS